MRQTDNYLALRYKTTRVKALSVLLLADEYRLARLSSSVMECINQPVDKTKEAFEYLSFSEAFSVDTILRVKEKWGGPRVVGIAWRVFNACESRPFDPFVGDSAKMRETMNGVVESCMDDLQMVLTYDEATPDSPSSSQI